MTKKLYYNCPIKALYMMREFGVKILIDDGDELYHIGVVELFSYLGEEREFEKFYIHPDSLDIFEPKLYDCFHLYDNINQDFLHYYSPSSNEDYLNQHRVKEIIYRNSKQFFMPEVEND